MQKRTKRKRRSGTVVSNRMDKTLVVTVERRFLHPRFGKYILTRKRYKVHDEANTCNIGDRVEIEETRPLSKEKRWRLLRIIERAPQFGSTV